MSDFEAWEEFRRQERYEPACDNVRCHHCGGECSGDVTETIHIDGVKGEVYICDDPDKCPGPPDECPNYSDFAPVKDCFPEDIEEEYPW